MGRMARGGASSRSSSRSEEEGVIRTTRIYKVVQCYTRLSKVIPSYPRLSKVIHKIQGCTKHRYCLYLR